MANLSTKADRSYPSLPTVTESTESHTAILKAIRDAIQTHERRDNNYLKSFIRFDELVALGIINEDGTPGDFTGGGGSGANNFGENLGGGEGVYAQNNGDALQFKSLIGGSGVSVSSDTLEITIEGAGGSRVESEYSRDGETWYPFYTDRDTWRRVREIDGQLRTEQWPNSLSEIPADQQRASFDRYLSGSTVTQSADARRILSENTGGYQELNLGQTYSPSRRFYAELVNDGTLSSVYFNVMNPTVTIPERETLTNLSLAGWAAGGFYRVLRDINTTGSNQTGAFTEYTSAVQPAVNDVQMIAVCGCSGRVWFGVNGTWLGPGIQDPERGYGGWFLDPAYTNLGIVMTALIGQDSDGHALNCKSTLSYLPPFGFPPAGNPTMSGYLSVVTEDSLADNTPLVINFQHDTGESIEDVNLANMFKDVGIYKHFPITYIDSDVFSYVPDSLGAPDPGPGLSIQDSASFPRLIHYDESLQVAQNEDFTIELVCKAGRFDGNRTMELVQMGGTGQKNGYVNQVSGNLAVVGDFGGPTSTSGLRIYLNYSNLTQLVISHQVVGGLLAEQYYHVIVERENDTIRAVLNGVEVGSYSGTNSDMPIGYAPGYGETNPEVQGVPMVCLLANNGNYGGAFNGVIRQCRLTAGVVRYGDGNWPIDPPNQKWSGADVENSGEAYWRKYRLDQPNEADLTTTVQFSTGNSEWHNGYQTNDTVARLIKSPAGAPPALPYEMTSLTPTKSDWNNNILEAVSNGTNHWSLGDINIPRKGLWYMEVTYRSINNNESSDFGIVGSQQRVGIGSSPNITEFGGFVISPNGSFRPNPGAGEPSVAIDGTFGVAFDPEHLRYWVSVDGKWRWGQPLDYDSGFPLLEGSNPSPYFVPVYQVFDDYIPGSPMIEIPLTPKYRVPEGFQAISWDGSDSPNRANEIEVIAVWPVGAVDTGDRMQFSSNGTSWHNDYLEGDTWARVPKSSTAGDGSGESWDGTAGWNSGIYANGAYADGGLLLTTDGEHTSGKHYWEVLFTQDQFPTGQVLGSSVVAPGLYYEDGATSFKGQVGASMGLIGPSTGEGAVDEQPAATGADGGYSDEHNHLWSIRTALTYHYLNRRDRVDEDGTETNGYAMQYEDNTRIGTTEYGAIRFGQTWGLAVDVTAGKYWVRGNTGSWIPSGDPAVGTGGFTIPSGVGYRFAVDFQPNPVQGGHVQLQRSSILGVPSGYTYHQGALPFTPIAQFSEADFYLPFEGSGEDIVDQSDNNLAVTVTGTVVQSDIYALVGAGGLFLDPATASGSARVRYVSSPADTSLNIPANTPFTVKLKAQALEGNPTSYQTLISSRVNGYTVSGGFWLRNRDSNRAMDLYINGTTIFTNQAWGVISGEEKEFLIERDGSDVIRFYTDGVYRTKVTDGSAIAIGGVAVGGKDLGSGGADSDWCGIIDDFLWIVNPTTLVGGGADTNYTVEEKPWGVDSGAGGQRYKEWRMGGAVQLFGTAAPSSATGKVGDVFTDTTNKNVYEKTDATTWTLRYTYT